MPASRLNYICVFEGESQVYGAASKDVVLKTPPPPGIPLEKKHILFITYEPDNRVLSVHPLPQEEVMAAEVTWPEKKESNEQA